MIREYHREFSKKFENVLMVHSGARGTLIYEKKFEAQMYTVCKGANAGCVGEHTVGVLHYVSDEIQDLQNCSTTPKTKI